MEEDLKERKRSETEGNHATDTRRRGGRKVEGY